MGGISIVWAGSGPVVPSPCLWSLLLVSSVDNLQETIYIVWPQLGTTGVHLPLCDCSSDLFRQFQNDKWWGVEVVRWWGGELVRWWGVEVVRWWGVEAAGHNKVTNIYTPQHSTIITHKNTIITTAIHYNSKHSNNYSTLHNNRIRKTNNCN